MILLSSNRFATTVKKKFWKGLRLPPAPRPERAGQARPGQTEQTEQTDQTEHRQKRGRIKNQNLGTGILLWNQNEQTTKRENTIHRRDDTTRHTQTYRQRTEIHREIQRNGNKRRHRKKHRQRPPPHISYVMTKFVNFLR